MIYTVYTLSDKENGACFYVGITQNSIYVREKTHISSGRNVANLPLYSFIRSNNINLVIEELDAIETTDKKEAYNLEKYWIDQLRQWGFTLYNSSQNLRLKGNKVSLITCKVGKQAHHEAKINSAMLGISLTVYLSEAIKEFNNENLIN